jgi:MbtH protein
MAWLGKKHPEIGWPTVSKVAEDLFMTVESSVADDLLQSWRWRIGSEARFFRATIFGDVFLQNPNGSIDWLDTGANELSEVSQDEESWYRVAYDNPAILFRASLLLHLRDLEIYLNPGQVYDWIHEPMLGGSKTVDNIQRVPLRVHLDSTGQLARKLSSNETSETGEDEKTIYTVVVNGEGQYSLVPSDQSIPDGWRSTGKTGTKQECIAIIESLWTDLRPESLQEKMDNEP